MERGLASALFVVFAIAGVIAGCSSGGGENASQPATTTTASNAPAPSTPAPSAPSSAAAGPADGASLFAQNCAGCHGQNGQNGRAPKLAGRKLAESEVASTVTSGKGRKMPAFGARLSKDQIDAIAKYVNGL